jgi:hypothetical protein
MFLTLFGVGCTPDTTGTALPALTSAPAQVIKPMTNVTKNPKQEFFSDPYPIHLAASDAGSIPLTLSGTTQDLLGCPGSLAAGCFHATPISVAIGPDLGDQASAADATLRNEFNNNIFQDNSGKWQMAVSYYVSNPEFPDATAWTVILHAHPKKVVKGAVPTDWVADSLLVGSFSTPTKADYDGKYYEDGNTLYLVYSARLTNSPNHDGIVAQLMDKPDTPDAAKPTVLLAPGDYNSELFNGLNQPDTFKLIETGNITRVDGKYLMAYSTGAYNEPDYKIGLAWSDTFLPAAGGSYRRITMTDTNGVWGKAGQPEVKYLLQSQEANWPNYIADTVMAPGVPAVVQDGQSWYLTFAGYLPSDAKPDPKTGHYDPSIRRPYYAPVSVDIPAGATVAQSSEADLANWITLGSNN